MMRLRTGTADLPLHGGTVPRWLAERMERLGRVIVEAIIVEYGRDELLRRLAHPFWFQSFGAVMGMDWHSSGITTSVVGALKRGLAPVADELGLHVCGGRGRHSRRTPDELLAVAERVGLDGADLARSSRLVAKVDSAAVQDGFQIYLHSFIVADDGRWVVIQQGMNGPSGLARRYHWLSETVTDPVSAPHAAILGLRRRDPIVNLADARADATRASQVRDVALGPDAVIARVREACRATQANPWSRWARKVSLAPEQLTMPGHHDVRPDDVVMKRLHGALAAAADRGPKDFAELLLVPGVGARTVEALALVAEVIHGAPARFSDPARFSFAHGGKDGSPFPVPLKVFDRTLSTVRRAVTRAKLGQDERLAALRRLDLQARRMEESERTGVSFDALIARERRLSWRNGGMTIAGPTPRPRRPRSGPQAPHREADGQASIAFG